MLFRICDRMSIVTLQWDKLYTCLAGVLARRRSEDESGLHITTEPLTKAVNSDSKDEMPIRDDTICLPDRKSRHLPVRRHCLKLACLTI